MENKDHCNTVGVIVNSFILWFLVYVCKMHIADRIIPPITFWAVKYLLTNSGPFVDETINTTFYDTCLCMTSSA